MPNMDHISTLPVELWQKILRYSISVPDFLDPDEMVDRFPPRVIFIRGLSSSRTYYKAETARNALRRVCRAWDEYLQKFAHRFLCIFDVVHGNVPIDYLKTAIRISMERHGDEFCEACQPQQIWPRSSELYPYVTGHTGYYQLCHDIFQSIKPLKATILDYAYNEDVIFQRGDWSRFLSNLARVQAANSYILGGTERIEVMESLLSMRHLYMHVDLFTETKFSVHSSTLTTLCIEFLIPDPSYTFFPAKDIYLPALRHLHILDSGYEEPATYDELAWLQLVRVVGKNLRTLHVPFERRCSLRVVPGEIWTICPKLEDLCSPE
jgi:hypothetical protein